MQRVFIGLAAGGDPIRAVVDEHLLEGAHGVGRVLAIVAIGGAEEVAQFDEAALGAAHVAVAVPLFEGIVGVGDLIAEEQSLGGGVGYAVGAQLITPCAEEGLEIGDRLDGLGAVVPIRLDAEEAEVVEALLQPLHGLTLGAGGQFLGAGATEQQRKGKQEREDMLDMLHS